MADRLPVSKDDVNLWRIPLQLSLLAVGVFVICMVVDTIDSQRHILPWWFTMGNIDDARAILSAMMSSVSTVLALIFSVALVVLSMVATLFGPRLLYRFIQDKVTQVTIGLFMASFVFILLTFLVTHQDEQSKFIPQAALIVCWLIVLAAFGFLVYYSHRIATSIQNPDMVARIADDFRASLVEATSGELANEVAPVHSSESGAPFRVTLSGYVQTVNHAALIEAAQAADVVVDLSFRPGQFVLQGECVAMVWPPERMERVEGALKQCVRLGRHRILRQDAEFGILQVVEIAIRALSPAVNDTFTGIACVDWLGDALLGFLGKPAPSGCWPDREGTIRVREPALRFERLVKAAFDQIRQASSDNPAVIIRMLNIISRVLPRATGERERAALRQAAQAIVESAHKGVTAATDLEDIEKAASLVLASPPVPAS